MTDWIKQEMHRKYHEIASLFPLMNDDEFEQLKADIAANGLMDPIWLHLNGSIIDGRNRHRACLEVSQKPHFRTWSGDGSLVSFVVSMNLHRRHLTSSQRAVVALELLPLLEAEAKVRQATSTGGATPQLSQKVAQAEKGRAAQQAADLAQTNRQYVSDAKKLQKEAPGLLEDVKAGNTTISKAKKELKERKREKEKRERLAEIGKIPHSDRWEVYLGDFRKVCSQLEPSTVDAIITDPPYPQEFLPLYGDLAKVSAQVLKPGGSLLVMVGQSYLPEIFALMTPHLTYNWTLAYLTPGGQSAQLWQRNVNTFWKPVLWFVNGARYEGRWIGDVVKSDTNDNDKQFHQWGQSESGMVDLIKRFCEPGDLILDPFCGGGTTGIAALSLGCRFIGIDIEKEAIETSKDRLAYV